MKQKKGYSSGYFAAIALTFSIIIIISLGYNLRLIQNHAVEKALTEANAIFELNLAYRLWNAGHGGVYVPVTDTYQPSPYLAVHPKRDITGRDGTVLTVVNPAIMTRNVHEILSKRSDVPILNKVTSLKYFNPDNKPDAWEERILRTFDEGKTEASEVVQINGQPYMRLLKPYYAEEGCLKCHAWQGYKVGDVRGGLSVGVPMKPYFEIASREKNSSYLTHVLIWFFGMSGIGLFGFLLNRAEHRIIESEWQFRTLAESASDWEYWRADDEKILFVSPSCEEITGYSPSEFLSDPALVSKIIHPEDRLIWSNHICSSLERDRLEVVFRIITREGETKWLSHICNSIVAGETVIGRRVSNRDITERIKAEEALKRWAHIFEHAQLGVTEVSPDGRTLEMMNPAFASLHGYTVDELTGRTGDILVPEGRSAEITAALGAAVEKGHHTFESEHLRKDGTAFPVQCDITVVKDESGNVRYMVVNAQDLTERKRMEHQLIESQKLESIGRLAAGIAHDFNNYLTVINGYGEILLLEENLDSTIRQQIQTIFDAGCKAAVITRQLLAFSRKQVLEIKPQSLTGIVQDILKILTAMVGEGVTIESNLGSSGVALLDRSQIEQVIMNLVVNARDAMQHGGRLFIETSDQFIDRNYADKHAEVEKGQYLVLSVTDTGEGIPKDIMDKIFEPFFTTKQMGHGTGLGLATVHGIVKQHKGHIYVYSEPHKGTTFKIYFPASAETAMEVGESGIVVVPLGLQKVLIVDDDASIHKLIADILAPLGFTCLEASGGEDALAVAESLDGSIDLLMTDVIMRGMSGNDLARKVLDRSPACKVIYMSGYTENVITHNGILETGIAFLAKPITSKALLRKVHEVLAG